MNEEVEIPPEVPREKKRTRKKQLYNNIKNVMEFYFSEANLSKDRWLAKKLKESESNAIELTHILGFNKIRTLTNDVNDIVKALRNSEILEVIEDYKIRRKTPVEYKQNLDDCVIYVEQIPPDADHDWVKSFFSCYGTVDYISIPRYSNSKKNKGFAFIEFHLAESAGKAVEEYKKAGRYLSSNVDPEELLSISTFQKKDIPAGLPIEIEVGQIENQTDLTIHKKRKKEELKEESPEHPEDAEKVKKIKLDNSEVFQENNKLDSVQLAIPTNIEEKYNEGFEGNVDESKKKKNRKKNKKTKKNKITPETTGFQILSKKDWKSLRNKYLNIQKEKMKRLKKHLKQIQFQINGDKKSERKQNSRDKNDKVGQINENNECVVSKDFVPGVIVKIEVSEPIVNLKLFKSEVNNKSDDIQYVDVKEGSFCAFIRLSTSESANDFCEKSVWNSAEVLKDEEEINYWKKLEEDRQNKISKLLKKEKKRGKEKVLKKAEKLLGKHITFDDDDEHA